MTLMLSNDDAARVLTVPKALAALEALYLDLGQGGAVYRGRTDLFAPTSADVGGGYSFGASVQDVGWRYSEAACCLYSGHLRCRGVSAGQWAAAADQDSGSDRQVLCGLVFLFSSATGELISILQDGMLQRFTVGAINAIGAKYLSRLDASSSRV